MIDASVLADLLLGRPQALEAIELELASEEQAPLHAPELIETEALNALRGLVRAKRITDQRASEAIADLGDLRLIRYPHGPLRPRVWELRHSLTAYDATYLALAEVLDESLLLTGDGGLGAYARRSIGAHRVRHVQ